jgi:hypothetical protein|tara:strand:- start:48 stop:1145 length:1098 start_codon:yes stop_codon:yes gene_type:complete
MSRKARSRALLRNLRKQARRGNLSALERKQLLQQEKRFRKGRSGFRKGLGAGLGAGLGVAAAQFLTSPAFKTLLESRPSLKDLRDRLKKEGVPADAVEDVANTVKGADKNTPPAEIVEKVEDRVLTPEAVGLTQEEFDASRARELSGANAAENLADQLEMERMQREDLLGPKAPPQPETRIEDIVLPKIEEIEEEEDPLVFQDEPVLFSTGMQPRGVPNLELPPSDRGELRGPDPAIEQRMAAVRESMRLRDNERSSENMRERAETLERLRREGGFDPFTGEYVDSDRQQRIDAEFDEDFMREAFTDEERAAEAENARLDALDRARAQGSGIPLRTGGPRVQAMGGKNPKMADLMKKVKAKYGIR